MERKKFPVTAYVLTLVCLMTVMTSSLLSGTLARYTAVGNGTASARVALWDVKSIAQPTNSINGTVFYTSTSSTTKKRYFRIENNSEVSAKITVKARYANNITGVPSAGYGAAITASSPLWSYATIAYDSGQDVVSGSGTTAVVLPKGYAVFSVLNDTGTPGTSTSYYTDNDTYKVQVWYEAVQVD